MRILLVAAEAMEFEGVLARADGVERASVAADWARSCRIGGHEALLVANGAGRQRAAAAAEAGIAAWRPEAVVSTGFCGALDERLDVADLVVGTGIIGCDASVTTGRACPAPTGTVSGRIWSGDRIVRTAEEKAKLRATGAIAVEMEAAGVAERAQECGLRFYCIRAVTDLAGESLANDFGAALRSDGHFDTIAILTGALRHPSTRVSELFRLRSRCKRAARSLGDFFAACGF
jgi:adenosylhomocysteine nucleosidase